MEEPIESQLHSESQLRVARLQDDVIKIIFKSAGSVVHGGTAIWRCYNGKRFSEDIDLYVHKKQRLQQLVNRIVQSGLRIQFNRERRGTIYYDISNDQVDISLQVKILSRKKGVLAQYERVDGVRTEIYALRPEALIGEKMEAYLDRRLIRDIYDIMVLSKSVVEKGKVAPPLLRFLSKMPQPKDENVLKRLVYSGPVPSFAEIVDYLKRWCSV